MLFSRGRKSWLHKILSFHVIVMHQPRARYPTTEERVYLQIITRTSHKLMHPAACDLCHETTAIFYSIVCWQTRATLRPFQVARVSQARYAVLNAHGFQVSSFTMDPLHVSVFGLMCTCTGVSCSGDVLW